MNRVKRRMLAVVVCAVAAALGAVKMVGPDAAYVTAEYLLDATTDREVRSGGLATYVMIRDAGQWKIRHSHTSSKRRT